MSEETLEIATLGGGCFWCLEAVYQEMAGVDRVVSGYAGGDVPDPGYRAVCSGSTGHAEVVQVHFDPDVVSFREILEVFFAIHDPTTRDRQGPDVGSQYRSIILTHSSEQREQAGAMIEELEAEGVFDDPVVTEVEPLEDFWPAEDHHQDFYLNNPRQPYCQAIVEPKLAKFRREFAQRRRDSS